MSGAWGTTEVQYGRLLISCIFDEYHGALPIQLGLDIFPERGNRQDHRNLCRSETQISLSTAGRFVALLVAVCLLIVLALTSHLSDKPSYFAPWYVPNILDGCHHIYLDMGTNMWDLNQSNTAFIFNSNRSSYSVNGLLYIRSSSSSSGSGNFFRFSLSPSMQLMLQMSI